MAVNWLTLMFDAIHSLIMLQCPRTRTISLHTIPLDGDRPILTDEEDKYLLRPTRSSTRIRITRIKPTIGRQWSAYIVLMVHLLEYVPACFCSIFSLVSGS